MSRKRGSYDIKPYLSKMKTGKLEDISLEGLKDSDNVPRITKRMKEDQDAIEGYYGSRVPETEYDHEMSELDKDKLDMSIFDKDEKMGGRRRSSRSRKHKKRHNISKRRTRKHKRRHSRKHRK